MKLSAKQFNRFIIFKLPAAFFCGVRVKELNSEMCISKVKFKWVNQNPFKSIYFAVLAMAAELSTGVLLLKKTKESNYKFSTLVIGLNGEFYKKAIGKIHFTCSEGKNLDDSIKKAIISNKGEAFKLSSIGVDEVGDEVAKFEFMWSIKIKETLS